MFFLTKSERDRTRPKEENRPQKGLRIVFPNGTTHFFPGELQFAWTLACHSPAYEWLDKEETQIEYGERAGQKWTLEKVVKEATKKEETHAT